MGRTARLAVIGMGIALSGFVFGADVTGFKSLALGEPWEELKARHPFIACVGPGRDDAGDCMIGSRYVRRTAPEQDAFARVGNLEVELSLRFEERRLARVMFDIPRGEYERIAAAMAEKYGAPTQVTVRTYTGVGGTVEGRMSTWVREDAVVTVQEQSLTRDRGLVAYSHIELFKRATQRKRLRGSDL